MRFTLKRKEILRGSKNFEYLLETGKKFEGKLLRCYMTTKPREIKHSAPEVLAAFAVKKLIKRAVDRNTIRRRMREAYRLHKPMLLTDTQTPDRQILLFFVYPSPRNSGLTIPPYSSIRDDVLHIVTSITKVL